MDATTRKRMIAALPFAEVGHGVEETQALMRAYEDVVEAAQLMGILTPENLKEFAAGTRKKRLVAALARLEAI